MGLMEGQLGLECCRGGGGGGGCQFGQNGELGELSIAIRDLGILWC